MSELGLSFRAAKEALIEELVAGGFRLHDDGSTVTGSVDIGGTAIEHEIVLMEDYPIAMPKVRTTGGEGGLSWHREADGRFCLWSDDEAAHLPWLTADQLITRIKTWHEMDAAGWPDDPPDLDLERYWPRHAALVIYPDLDDLADRHCKIVKGPNETFQLAPGKAPRKRRARVREWAATIVDIGEIEQPIHNFDELADLMPTDDAVTLRSQIKDGTIRFMMIRYQRQGHHGTLALVAFDRNPHDLRAAESAHNGDTTKNLRAGLDAEQLRDRRVAIVGVGAVGSQAAEMLARSGIGQLTLIDADLIRPGNCIRHVAVQRDVGRPKVDAVKDHLVRAQLIDPQNVIVDHSALRSAKRTEELFRDHDLIIDSTANGPASALLMTASRLLNRPLVAVCLLRNGTIARVDRNPLLDGEQHAAAVPSGGPETDLREGGCGDPVSPTPPWACSAAAARAVGVATDLLSGRCSMPPSIIDDLIVFPDKDAGPR